MKHNCDFLVLGGGSAGYAAARTAQQLGARVAIADGAPELGGLCILRGCMPSKTLLYSAEILHRARHGALFGLHIPTASANLPALRGRKRRIIAEFAEYRQQQLESDRFTLIRSHATFRDPHTVSFANGDTLTAQNILIATGSVVAVPPVPGLVETPFLTSDDILELDRLPESVLVLGGGVVACELTQYLARLGCRITQLQRSPRLLKEFPPAASTAVAEAFREEGVDLHTGTRLERVFRTPNGVAVDFLENGSGRRAEASHLFLGLGRRPNLEGLGLETLGLTLRSNGQIATDQWQRTSLPHIYAAGDCCGPYEIVHTAIMQGETAARHALGQPAAPVCYDWLTQVVFTDPAVAVCGRDAESLQESKIDFVEATYPFADHGKSILMEAKRGYVAVRARRPDGVILGADCVGPEAGELIHAMAAVLPLGATMSDLLKVHWYHPTLAEIWSYPIEECLEQLRQTS